MCEMSVLELTAMWDAAEKEAGNAESGDASGTVGSGGDSQRAVSAKQLREWEKAYGSSCVRRQDGARWKDRLEVAEDLKMARQSLAAWHSLMAEKPRRVPDCAGSQGEGVEAEGQADIAGQSALRAESGSCQSWQEQTALMCCC